MLSFPSTPSSPSGADSFRNPSLPSTAPTSLADSSSSSSSACPDDTDTRPLRAHPKYFVEVLNFEVEGMLLQLPKAPFLEYSDTFAERYQTDSGGAVKLDVSLEEFESFLDVFLSRPTVFDTKQNLGTTKWISVLELSTEWMFNDVRKLAIEQLTMLLADPVQRVSLAKKYHVQEWLLSGYRTLVEREDSITDEEAMKLGNVAAFKLSKITIKRLRRALAPVSQPSNGFGFARPLNPTPEPPVNAIDSDIVSSFSTEFADLEACQNRYLTHAERLEKEKRRRLHHLKEAKRNRLLEIQATEGESQKRREEEERIKKELKELDLQTPASIDFGSGMSEAAPTTCGKKKKKVKRRDSLGWSAK